MRTDEDRQLAEEVESALRALGIASLRTQHGAIAPAVSDLRGEPAKAETVDGEEALPASTWQQAETSEEDDSAADRPSGANVFGTRHRSERYDPFADDVETNTDWPQPSRS